MAAGATVVVVAAPVAAVVVAAPVAAVVVGRPGSGGGGGGHGGGIGGGFGGGLCRLCRRPYGEASVAAVPALPAVIWDACTPVRPVPLVSEPGQTSTEQTLTDTSWAYRVRHRKVFFNGGYGGDYYYSCYPIWNGYRWVNSCNWGNYGY